MLGKGAAPAAPTVASMGKGFSSSAPGGPPPIAPSRGPPPTVPPSPLRAGLRVELFGLSTASLNGVQTFFIFFSSVYLFSDL
jgi:hypothetical protein